MKQHKYEIIVGITIIAAIIISTFGYIFIREIPVRQKGYDVTILFNNVSGLTEGDAVKVSGLKVGRVREMELKKEHVAVRIWLDGKVPFSKDSRAIIKSIGMIGEKYIDLLPGSTDAYLSNGDLIQGSFTEDLADVGGPLSDMIAEAKEILSKLNDTMDRRSLKKAQSDAFMSLSSLNKMTTSLEKNFDDNMVLLENSLTNIDNLTSEMSQFWQNNNESLDKTLANISASTEKLPTVVSKLDSTLSVTQNLLAKVQNSEGSVGKALSDDELYTNATKTLEDVQLLLNEIKKSPGKYFNASLIDLF